MQPLLGHKQERVERSRRGLWGSQVGTQVILRVILASEVSSQRSRARCVVSFGRGLASGSLPAGEASRRYAMFDAATFTELDDIPGQQQSSAKTSRSITLS